MRRKKVKGAIKSVFDRHTQLLARFCDDWSPPPETHRKRIEAVFPDAHVTQYRENSIGERFVEFVLVGGERYSLDYRQLVALAKLTGSTDIDIHGWVDGSCEHTDAYVLGNPTFYVLVTNPRL